MSMDEIKAFISQRALDLGFCAAGITDVRPFERHEAVALAHIERGFMEGLHWYTGDRVRRGSRPVDLLPSARSIISVAMPYPLDLGEPHSALGGRVSRYAWGPDYHGLMKDRLRALAAGLGEYLGSEVRSRVYVDDGPIPDRAAVERSGVGWFGKNTNIIVPGYGSWVFLGEVVTDVDLEPDRPLEKSCGGCTACLEACPTGALVAPYVLDNRRCIAYLTIENRGAIPRDLRPLIGDRLFGCDTCQEVCPVNHRMREALPRSRREEVSIPRLAGVLDMQAEEFRQRFRGSAIWRAKLSGLQRNACVVLGNLGDASAIPVLVRVLEEGEALFKIHAAWALGRTGGQIARGSLEKALCREQDAKVLEEVRLALEGCA